MRRRRRSKIRRVLGQNGVEDITRRLSTSKIEETSEEECCWDVFIEEILPCLPAENLETLKTVCRNWSRIISCPYFVGLHLNNAYNQSHIRVLTISSLPESTMNMTEDKYNINFDVETKQVPFPPLFGKRVFVQFLGTCDGLLCLFLLDRVPVQHSNTKIAVYNPSTGKYFWVQPPIEYNDSAIKCSWFGHHPSSGEYVLVLWDLDCKVGVYKFSGKHTLEEIQSTPQFRAPVEFYTFEERCILLHGALHWPAELLNDPTRRRAFVICRYHLEHNKYSEISAPGPVQNRFKIGVNAEGCLFAIFNSEDAKLEMEMWVMKEYGVEQSWAKQANFVRPYSYSVLSPLGLFPNGDLILDEGSELIKYSFNDNKGFCGVVHLFPFLQMVFHPPNSELKNSAKYGPWDSLPKCLKSKLLYYLCF